MLKVALLAKSKIQTSFKMKYSSWSVDSRSESFISIGHSVTEIWHFKVERNQQIGTMFLYIWQFQLPGNFLITYA